MAASQPNPKIGGLPEKTLKAYGAGGNQDNSPTSQQSRPSSLLNKLIDRQKPQNKDPNVTQDKSMCPQIQKDQFMTVEIKSDENNTIEPKSEETQPTSPTRVASDKSVKGAAAVPTLNLNKEEFKLSVDSELKREDA